MTVVVFLKQIVLLVWFFFIKENYNLIIKHSNDLLCSYTTDNEIYFLKYM